MAIRRWLIGGLAVCALTASVWARTGTVKMRDGGSYQGDITEGEDGRIVVKVHNVDMRIDRRDVAAITYVDDAAADFKKRLAALGPKDVKGRLDLAQWALSQQQYEWAKQAGQSALDIDPNSKEATDFVVMVRRQQDLERAPKASQNSQPGGDPLLPDAPGTTKTPPGALEHKQLSADDINTIRQFELGGEESNYRATFTNDVRRRYVTKYPTPGGSLAQFMSLPVDRQVRNILHDAPDMRNDVRIVSDPQSMSLFKTRVQPAILASCATTACHGGTGAGNFVLITPADSDPAVYTNFYILSQYVKKLDKAGAAQAQMIDRTAPAKSLLLQYTLPTDAADLHHPETPNYRPPFRNTADPRYKAVSDWLTGSLSPATPDYGIKYTPPGSTGTDASSTKPAGK